MSDTGVGRRKKQLSEFRELFNALFKIPDHDVQDRVLQAINGIVSEKETCNNCWRDYKKPLTRDVGIQTLSAKIISTGTQTLRAKVDATQKLPIKVANDILDTKVKIDPEVLAKDMNNDVNTELLDSSTINGSLKFYGNDAKFVTQKDPDKFIEERQVKRRKRNKRVPIVQKAEVVERPHLRITSNDHNSSKRPRLGSCASDKTTALSTGDIDNLDLDAFNEINTMIPENTNDFMNIMKREWDTCGIFDENGLLPIHKAVLDENVLKLKSQIAVFKFKGINGSQVLNKNGESPLLLSIIADADPSIVKILLANNPDLCEVDETNNSLLHLTVTNNETTDILKMLLANIKLDMLQTKNDQGLTVLHIAVIEGKNLMCKTILEHVNISLGISNLAAEHTDERTLTKIYTNTLSKLNEQPIMPLNCQKAKIINEIDMKHGRSALYFALAKKSKLLTYMLLVEFADPKRLDYTDTDCLTYATLNYDDAGVISALINASQYISKCMQLK